MIGIGHGAPVAMGSEGMGANGYLAFRCLFNFNTYLVIRFLLCLEGAGQLLVLEFVIHNGPNINYS